MADDNVVQLPLTDPFKLNDNDRVLVCECGCRTFYMRVDGRMFCCSCEAVQDEEGGWADHLPAPHRPASTSVDDQFSGRRDVPDMVKHRYIRILKEHWENIWGVVVIHTDGTVNTCHGDTDTPERVQWLRRRLARAYRLMRS